MEIGLCGKACGVCRFKEDNTCDGCVEENERLDRKCPIYECARTKKVQYCLKCLEYPCNVLRGLSMSYCLVSALKKYKNI